MSTHAASGFNISDSKAWVSSLSCPTHRAQDHRLKCISARAPESSRAVDAVLQDLLGDFDRVPLPSDDLPSDSLTAASHNAAQPEVEEASVLIQEDASEQQPCTPYDGPVLSTRAGKGLIQIHRRKSASSARIVYPKKDADPVPQLFPRSNYAREQASACEVTALLCAAHFHDELFDTSILDPTVDVGSLTPNLGQQPPATTTGSGRLKRALQSMNIQTELLTLQHATVDDHLWTKDPELLCTEEDGKTQQPTAQHGTACWSWKQVEKALVMVLAKYPRTCRQCLSAPQPSSASNTAPPNTQGSQSSHQSSTFTSKLCGFLRKLEPAPARSPLLPGLEPDTAQFVESEIYELLKQERQLLPEVLAATKAALELELLLCVLQSCSSKQNVLESIQSFRWYCGYQAPVLISAPSRRSEFIALLGRVLSRLGLCEPENAGSGTSASPHVLQVAGVWSALSERSSPGEQDMHPYAASHLQSYVTVANCEVLMQLTFHEAGNKNSPFSGMNFSHLETIALALQSARGKHSCTTPFQKATRLLATRLAHRIKFHLKAASPEEVAQAVQAFCCVRCSVSSNETVPQEVQALCATFKKHFYLTSPSQTSQITTDLLVSLIKSLTAGGATVHRSMLAKLETMLQQQVSSTVSAEAFNRLQLVHKCTGSPDLVSVESVSQQVTKALDIASASTPQASQTSCDPWSEQQEAHGTQEFGQNGAQSGTQCAHGASLKTEKFPELKKQNESFAKHVVLAACEHLYAGSLSSNTWHQLVRLMVQQRLNGSISWPMTGKLMRLANKHGLSGPSDSKKSREFQQCLELLVNQHARKGGVLHTEMMEQLSVLNTLQRERVFSAPLTSAAAQRVHECFTQPLGDPQRFSASARGCSEALVPALLLQALSRTFDRYSGKPQHSDVQLFLSQIKLENPATLNEYMQTAIRITKPWAVKHSPDAQRIRAAMISTASNIIPLYNILSEGCAQYRSDSEQLRALNSSVQDVFAEMYGTVKHMVSEATKPQLFDKESTSNEAPEEAESIDSESSRPEATASSRGSCSKQEWDWKTASEDNISVYYCLGQLWPLVQLALADKAIKLKKGTITTMSVMRAALPLILKSTNVRHITPIVTCTQRYQYINTALYDHVMSLIHDQYVRLCEAHRAKGDDPEEHASHLIAQQKQYRTPRSKPQAQVHEPPSFAVKDKMQKMHIWLVSRALRSSYLPGKVIVNIMAERVERLSDRRIHPLIVERYLAMYLDGLPASRATLEGLKRAFLQRKDSWRDFAVASAMQLFAERDFRCRTFEREAVKWFDRRAAKKIFMRHSLCGALNQTRQLWLLHGNTKFPEYSQELQQAIGGHAQISTPSPVQLEIFKAVLNVYPAATLEEPACDGQLSVDVALRYNAAEDSTSNEDQGSVKVAIECDGPHHFFINTKPYKQTPKTKLRNAMLERDGWQVLQIDTYTWYSTTWHPNSEERHGIRRLFIVNLLKKNGLEHMIPPQQSV